jgi:NADPH-dependent curcumin reductase CurA
VNIYFDNVGGELLDTVLRRIAMNARIVLCGDISTYNLDGPPPPLYNIRYLMGRRARMEGFNTLDLWDHYDEAMVQLKQWLADGTVSYRTDMLEGVDRAPEALVRLFTGDHLGKLIINVAP